MTSQGWQIKKKERTKKKILEASRKVFGAYPYGSATTRMIAEKAKVDHALIHYHFGSKEKLFRKMTYDISQDFIQALSDWFEGMEKMTPVSGFELFTDRVLDYTMQNQETMQLFLINMSQYHLSQEIPGLEYLHLFAEQARKFAKVLFPNIDLRGDFEKMIISFTSSIISFVGGKTTHAIFLDLNPESPEYRQWVKETLTILFLPLVEKTFQGNMKFKKAESANNKR